MSLAAHGAHEVPIAARRQSQDTHAFPAVTVQSIKSLLLQGLRLIFVMTIFAVILTAIIWVRVAHWLPPFPQ